MVIRARLNNKSYKLLLSNFIFIQINMGKAAGIWKKIKSVAKQIGDGAAKALAWGNTNIIQPLKPIIGNIIDMFDPSGTGSKVFNTMSDGYDNYLEYTNQKPKDGFSQITDFGREVFEHTQNPGRYKKPFNRNKEINLDDW